MTFGNLLAWLVFGMVGMAAFGYGKKQQRPKTMAIGGLLMGYPYFVSNTWLLWIIGLALTAAIFVWTD